MKTIDIVFDGPPSHEAPRFVEVERDGKSVRIGQWVQRSDGFWALRIPDPEADDVADEDAETDAYAMMMGPDAY